MWLWLWSDTLQKLPSMYDYGVNFYRATIFRGCLTHRNKFFFLFLNLDAVPKNSAPDILTYWASWNLEIYQTIIVSVMFSLPLIVGYAPSHLESKTDVIFLVESATIFIGEPIIPKNVQKFLKFTLKMITTKIRYFRESTISFILTFFCSSDSYARRDKI